jgi:hypothetical protein
MDTSVKKQRLEELRKAIKELWPNMRENDENREKALGYITEAKNIVAYFKRKNIPIEDEQEYQEMLDIGRRRAVSSGKVTKRAYQKKAYGKE